MVFTEGNQDKYLDEDGLQYLIQKLKEKIPSGGDVDLSDYYNKEEIDKIIKNLPAGGTGTDGKDGVGIQTVKLVNYELVISLTDGTEINLGNVRGADGAKGQDGINGKDGTNGKDGADGKNGISPTISIVESNTGHTITVTDKTGTQSFEVLNGIDGTDGKNGADGVNGSDGISPTIEVTEITGGHTVAITDKNGTKTFDVLDGKDGKDGTGGSGGGGTSGDVYSTEETAIGTWYDGSTIYRKVVMLTIKTTIKSGTPEITSVKHGIENFKHLVDLRCIPEGYSMKSAIGDLGFTSVNLYNATSWSNFKDYTIRPTVSYDSLMIDAGYSWRGCELTCIIEYTKKSN